MVLLVLGLVVLGPEKLPDAIRRVGHLYGELKRMSSGVQGDLRRALDEPMRELRGTAESARSMVKEATSPFAGAVMSAAPAMRGTAETPAAAPEAAAPEAAAPEAAAPEPAPIVEPSEHAIDDVD